MPKSKKPSVANSISRRPDPLIFFVDRSVGKRFVPEALRQAGAQVHLHDDHFEPMTPDELQLAHAGQRGWLVLTKDDNIHRHQLALSAIIRNRVRTFVLPRGNLSGDEMATILVHALGRIRQMVLDHPPPLIAIVTRRGKVRRLNLKLLGSQ